MGFAALNPSYWLLPRENNNGCVLLVFAPSDVRAMLAPTNIKIA
jgi:hypothetical protein